MAPVGARWLSERRKASWPPIAEPQPPSLSPSPTSLGATTTSLRTSGGPVPPEMRPAGDLERASLLVKGSRGAPLGATW